ncbi:MAG: riboflavin synthase [Desulfobacterales bacterium]|uniref:Riboflavin synthase n=1 Tax=Candidatus Desulfaltia bathyphila TaxID=2841697 RepID=A0A8J6N5V5_9BACT|nr:riboflavin synthase [Candidatus Desulfaltia bathyphila]MBL7194916.1 riboflavin synthase [Desulfobacterales bacterium]MBL7207263.1 riboflavin synthase [Desulfobacterales bacterium]
MFTGIIEGLGTITAIRPSNLGKRLLIDADFPLDQTKIGDSIAISGVCVTVIIIAGKRFEIDISPETIAKTTFDTAKIGDRVNLERALRLSDRIDGHLVSGHIDGIGTIKDKKRTGNAIIVVIDVPEFLSRYMITKGSVAVDGISLTINNRSRDCFDVSIIPHTAKLTTIGLKKAGDYVNIETDMIGKYIENFIAEKPANNIKKETGQPSVDKQFLTKTGFL